MFPANALRFTVILALAGCSSPPATASLSAAAPGSGAPQPTPTPNRLPPPTPATAAQMTLVSPFSSGAPGTMTVFLDAPLPSDVTQVRLRLANYNPAVSQAVGAVSGAQVAIGTHDGSFGFVGPPTQRVTVDLPATGEDIVLPWTTVGRGADGKILVAVSVPAGANVALESMVHWGKAAVGTAQTYPVPAGLVDYNQLPYWAHLEFETTKRRFVVLGDSVARGYDGAAVAVGPNRSAWFSFGADKDVAVDDAAVGGSLLSSWASAPGLVEHIQFHGASVIVELGLNDMGVSGNAVEFMKAQLAHLIETARAGGAAEVFVGTITPNRLYFSANALRLAWNPWIRTLPYAIDGVIDADAVLADPAHPDQLLPQYDTGDGVHPNAAGHAAVKPRLEASVGL